MAPDEGEEDPCREGDPGCDRGGEEDGKLRIFGWLFIGMGAVLGIIASLTFAGLEVPIDFFGIDVDSPRERLIFAGGCAVAIAAGLGLRRLGRKRQKTPSETGTS